jgi:hypothetical protein
MQPIQQQFLPAAPPPTQPQEVASGVQLQNAQ